jgi:hypothetical protein
MDLSLAGNAGTPFRMVVEEGKIREFARATKSGSPAYLPDNRPPSVSPVTFLASAALWAGPTNSPWGDARLDWGRVLHGEQEFRFPGPPPAAGTVLTAQTRIERISERQGRRSGTMHLAELVTEYRDTSGALVAESRSTVIETGRAGGASER